MRDIATSPSPLADSYRLKICVVIPTHWDTRMGGAEYQGKALVENLLGRKDLDIHFIGRRIRSTQQNIGYTIHEVGHGRPTAGTFLADVPSLLMTLHRIKPDVIYQRVACTYTGIVAFYARRNRARLVWHVAHDRDVQPSPPTSLSNLHAILNRLDERIIDYGIRNAGAIVVQTRHQAALLERHYGRSDSTLIPNFHPIPISVPDRPTEPITISWIANIKSFKRPELFLRLADDFRHRHDVRFVMIGAPPLADPTWPTLLAAIKALPNLRYLGELAQEDVNDWLSRSHIFVNTSESEGFANTFIQAWMRGVPVVSLEVDPDGLLKCRQYGYCAHGNYVEFRNFVETLVNDPTLRVKLGEQAITYSHAEHSPNNIKLLINVLLPGFAAVDSTSSQ